MGGVVTGIAGEVAWARPLPSRGPETVTVAVAAVEACFSIGVEESEGNRACGVIETLRGADLDLVAETEGK